MEDTFEDWELNPEDLGQVFDYPPPFSDLSVVENVEVPLQQPLVWQNQYNQESHAITSNCLNVSGTHNPGFYSYCTGTVIQKALPTFSDISYGSDGLMFLEVLNQNFGLWKFLKLRRFFVRAMNFIVISISIFFPKK